MTFLYSLPVVLELELIWTFFPPLIRSNNVRQCGAERRSAKRAWYVNDVINYCFESITKGNEALTFRAKVGAITIRPRTSTTGCVDPERHLCTILPPRHAKPPNFYPGTTGNHPKSVTQAESTDSQAATVAIPATWKLINFSKCFWAAAKQISGPFWPAFHRDSTTMCTKLISFSVRRRICQHMAGDEVSSSTFSEIVWKDLHFCSRKYFRFFARPMP